MFRYSCLLACWNSSVLSLVIVLIMTCGWRWFMWWKILSIGHCRNFLFTMDVGVSMAMHILFPTEFSPVVEGFISSQRSEEYLRDGAPSSPNVHSLPRSAFHPSLLLDCCLTSVPGELSCKQSERNMSWFLPGLGLCLVLVPGSGWTVVGLQCWTGRIV